MTNFKLKWKIHKAQIRWASGDLLGLCPGSAGGSLLGTPWILVWFFTSLAWEKVFGFLQTQLGTQKQCEIYCTVPLQKGNDVYYSSWVKLYAICTFFITVKPNNQDRRQGKNIICRLFIEFVAHKQQNSIRVKFTVKV